MDENAAVADSPELEREVVRLLEVARVAITAASEACTEGMQGPRLLPTITLDGLEAIASKQPPPPSGALSSLSVYQDLKQYRAGTLTRRAAARSVEQLQKLKWLGVYEVKMFDEGHDKVEGRFEARLVVIDMVAKKPICHVPLSINMKRDEPDPGDPSDKARTFASKVRGEIDGTLFTLFE